VNAPVLAFAALACFVVVAVLGTFAAQRAPTGLDVAGGALRGNALPLAAFFTLLGRWYVLTLIAIVVACATIAWRGDVRVIAVLFASQVAAQGAVTVLKVRFHRARPPGWLLFHEPDFSYPSGHAVTSIVFYVALAMLVLHTGVVPHAFAAPLAIVLVVCAAGIPWSRLALDAHYVTDVVGGLVFGCGWLCAALAIASRVMMSARVSP
jgi:undecaprenyl-diphosphatase